MKGSFDPVRHEYRTALGYFVPSVTQILSKAGLCDFSFVEEEIRMHSLMRGTTVHWMLQLEDEGALDYRRVPLKMRPYRKAYLDWKRASGFVPIWIEHQFISRYGYAGTIDRYGKFPRTGTFPVGSHAIIDLKTGVVQDWVRYQLAAYSMQSSPNRALASSVRRIALALRADGTYRVKEFQRGTFDHDFAKFMLAKERVDGGHVSHERAGN